MKFKLYGKIKARQCRVVKRKDGTSYDLYSLIVEESGKYPQVFRVSSKDPSLFGKVDGPFAVGRFATIEGFVNGYAHEVTGKDGKPFKLYVMNLNVTHIEEVPREQAAPAADPASDDVDDMPY